MELFAVDLNNITLRVKKEITLKDLEVLKQIYPNTEIIIEGSN